MPLDMESSSALEAITDIINLIRNSKATTYQELEDDINQAVSRYRDEEGSLESLAVTSACEIFRQFITRMSESQLTVDFCSLRATLCDRAEAFLATSKKARSVIAEQLFPFLKEGTSALIHGFSKAVLGAVLRAAETRRLRLYVTEGRPGCEGYKVLAALQEAKCSAQVELVPDTAVASTMPGIDVILLGAGVVTENGGIINSVGSFQIALLAKTLSKPLYVCTESLKLAKVYPLDQSELPQSRRATFTLVGENKFPEFPLSKRTVDYTPPQYITQIYTDLGIMTPAAMSDELLKLYT